METRGTAAADHEQGPIAADDNDSFATQFGKNFGNETNFIIIFLITLPRFFSFFFFFLFFRLPIDSSYIIFGKKIIFSYI